MAAFDIYEDIELIWQKIKPSENGPVRRRHPAG
jgi:hypothetical protein